MSYPQEALDEVEEFERRHLTKASRELICGLFRRERIKPNEDLLEIACGTGYFASLLPPEFRRQLIQTDASEQLLAAAKNRFPEGRYQRLDARHMCEIPDASIDRIFALDLLNTLHHYPDDIKRIFDEVRRVLRNGGKFYHLLDRMPKVDCVLEAMREEGLIDDESAIIAGEIDNCKVVQIMNIPCPEKQRPQNFCVDPSAYFSKNVIGRWFHEYLSSPQTHEAYMSKFSPSTPLGRVIFGVVFPLVVANHQLRIREMVRKEIVGENDSSRRRLCLDPLEPFFHPFGLQRRVEAVGMYLNVGAKE